MTDAHFVPLGHISSVYGVRGWLKIHSDARPREAILTYRPLYIKRNQQWQALEIEEARPHSKTFVMKIVDCDDRTHAATLVGCELAIMREQLAALAPDEYYWTDLIGLQVENLQGVILGEIDHLFETGANDVMVVMGEKQRLLPFTQGHTVLQVDLQAKKMLVDWDADF